MSWHDWHWTQTVRIKGSVERIKKTLKYEQREMKKERRRQDKKVKKRGGKGIKERSRSRREETEFLEKIKASRRWSGRTNGARRDTNQEMGNPNGLACPCSQSFSMSAYGKFMSIEKFTPPQLLLPLSCVPIIKLLCTIQNYKIAIVILEKIKW